MLLCKQIAGFNSTLDFEPVLVTQLSSTGQTSDQYWYTPPSSTGQLSDQYWFKNGPNAQALFITVNQLYNSGVIEHLQ